MEEYLKKYNVKKEELFFEGHSYPYWEAIYKYEKEQMLKYYIFDLTEENLFVQKCIDFENEKVFYEFEKTLLEEEFFHSKGDTRFNIYLLFVVGKGDKLLNNMLIQKDFRYARKIILQKEDAEDFLHVLFPMKREGVRNIPSDVREPNKVMEELIKSKKDAAALFDKALNEWFITMSYNKRKESKKIDPKIVKIFAEISSINANEDKNIPKKNKKEDYVKLIQADYHIREISKISVENYRRYQKQYVVPFKRVNLIYGENGAGKTSLLEAIEFGITGYNRKAFEQSPRNCKIQVHCVNSQNKECIFSGNQNYMSIAEYWYGIKVKDNKEFNRLFAQYNYFDTSWASTFAIEGEEQVNIEQLKKFLGIQDLEKYEETLCAIFNLLLEVANDNKKRIEKIKVSEKDDLFNKFRKKDDISNAQYILLKTGNHDLITQCTKKLQMLEDKINIVTLDDILKTHITKMQKIFKLLICSNEYSDLQYNQREILAVRSTTKEKVSMSEMSTGQKVCLALSFMFALFLSNEHAPNIIMLDEPVANLDDLHMLNLLDVLRRLAMAGTQIFFTTSNPDVAKLFRRKFTYLEEDFGFYRVTEEKNEVEIQYERYSVEKETPVEVKKF